MFTFAVLCINDLQFVYDIVSVCLLITIVVHYRIFCTQRRHSLIMIEDEITGLIKTKGFLVNFLSESHALDNLVQ